MFLWFPMFILSTSEPRSSRREILGPWDYLTNGPGDVFALPLLDFAVGSMMYRQGASEVLLAAACFVGLLGAYYFWRTAIKYSRASQDKDWWFRFRGMRDGWSAKVLGASRVDMTTAGAIHLVYYAVQVAMASLAVWYFIILREGWMFPGIIGLAGALAYVSTYVIDLRQGKFS